MFLQLWTEPKPSVIPYFNMYFNLQAKKGLQILADIFQGFSCIFWNTTDIRKSAALIMGV